jgi:hypothetical protein
MTLREQHEASSREGLRQGADGVHDADRDDTRELRRIRRA